MRTVTARLVNRSAVVAVALALPAVLVPTLASAQANCAVYGKLALQQQQENVQRNCGFTGTSWSSDLRSHMTWCSSVGPEQWKAELQKRAQMLSQQCKG